MIGVFFGVRSGSVSIGSTTMEYREALNDLEGAYTPSTGALEEVEDTLRAGRDLVAKSPQLDPTVVAKIEELLRQGATAARELAHLRHQTELDERRYKLLREYAAQGLAQSKVSFLASLSAAVLGFIVILIGSALAIVGVASSQALVAVCGGTVIDAVSLLFFIQDRRNQRTMFNFFERLRQDRKLDESLALLNTISDENIQSRMRAVLSLHFAGIDDKQRLLDTAIGKPSNSETSTAGPGPAGAAIG